MEVKNLVLDVLLPGIAVIATGLFTYALTSGPEEFEDLVHNNAIIIFSTDLIWKD